ncbi:hypothetical protein NE237_027219 [Protea cynaroides]|uniref:Uncharacterized protein n=1 Tax=Protea cynaroides TaxID=273540 RepID=A0A9Q0JSZ2_9MAGN|nr:hypothetical protein NE237_027219 [Protea cynaroides]
MSLYEKTREGTLAYHQEQNSETTVREMHQLGIEVRLIICYFFMYRKLGLAVNTQAGTLLAHKLLLGTPQIHKEHKAHENLFKSDNCFEWRWIFCLFFNGRDGRQTG